VFRFILLIDKEGIMRMGIIVNSLPLVSTLSIVISAILVGLGWYLILKGKRSAHQKMMTTASIFAILFLVIYILRTFFVGNTSFGGPDSIKPYYIFFLIFHIFLAVTGLVFGSVTLSYAFKGRFIKHKKIGPWAAVIWFCSATTGIMVYLALYLIWERGQTTSMMKAILGL
jgi:putative membrane protein